MCLFVVIVVIFGQPLPNIRSLPNKQSSSPVKCMGLRMGLSGQCRFVDAFQSECLQLTISPCAPIGRAMDGSAKRNICTQTHAHTHTHERGSNILLLFPLSHPSVGCCVSLQPVRRCIVSQHVSRFAYFLVSCSSIFVCAQFSTESQ